MSWGCARARAGQPSRNRRETRDCAARPKLDGRMESRMRHVPNGPGWRSGRSGSWFGRRTRKKNCAGGGLYLEGQSRRRPAAASPLTLLRRGPACPPSLSLPLSPSWGCSATSTRLGRPAHPGHGADSTPSTGALRKEAPVPQSFGGGSLASLHTLRSPSRCPNAPAPHRRPAPPGRPPGHPCPSPALFLPSPGRDRLHQRAGARGGPAAARARARRTVLGRCVRPTPAAHRDPVAGPAPHAGWAACDAADRAFGRLPAAAPGRG